MHDFKYLGVDSEVINAAAIQSYVAKHLVPDEHVLISFDTESSNNTMIEIGLVVFVRPTVQGKSWGAWQNFSACCEGAAFDPNESTNRDFWCKFPDQFARIVSHAKPLGSQLALVNALVNEITRMSRSVKFLARPAAYDFHVVAQACEHVGIRNPIGFGGTAKLICAGNTANALSRLFGAETPPSFETLMRRIGVVTPTHAAVDDAMSQIAVFLAVEEGARESIAHAQTLCTNNPSDPQMIKFKLDRLQTILMPETPEETALDKRREEPTEEMRRAFAALLESLKPQ